MADAALRARFTRAGFTVTTRQTSREDSRGGSLWSIRGNGVVKNNLTKAEAEAFLRQWKESH